MTFPLQFAKKEAIHVSSLHDEIIRNGESYFTCDIDIFLQCLLFTPVSWGDQRTFSTSTKKIYNQHEVFLRHHQLHHRLFSFHHSPVKQFASCVHHAYCWSPILKTTSFRHVYLCSATCFRRVYLCSATCFRHVYLCSATCFRRVYLCSATCFRRVSPCSATCFRRVSPCSATCVHCAYCSVYCPLVTLQNETLRRYKVLNIQTYNWKICPKISEGSSYRYEMCQLLTHMSWHFLERRVYPQGGYNIKCLT